MKTLQNYWSNILHFMSKLSLSTSISESSEDDVSSNYVTFIKQELQSAYNFIFSTQTYNNKTNLIDNNYQECVKSLSNLKDACSSSNFSQHAYNSILSAQENMLKKVATFLQTPICHLVMPIHDKANELLIIMEQMNNVSSLTEVVPSFKIYAECVQFMTKLVKEIQCHFMYEKQKLELNFLIALLQSHVSYLNETLQEKILRNDAQSSSNFENALNTCKQICSDLIMSTEYKRMEIIESTSFRCGHFVLNIDEISSYLSSNHRSAIKSCDLEKICDSILRHAFAVSELINTPTKESIIALCQNIMCERNKALSFLNTFNDSSDLEYFDGLCSEMTELFYELEETINESMIYIFIMTYSEDFSEKIWQLASNLLKSDAQNVERENALSEVLKQFSSHLHVIFKVGHLITASVEDPLRILVLQELLSSLEKLSTKMIPAAVQCRPANLCQLKLIQSHWRKQMSKLNSAVDSAIHSKLFLQISEHVMHDIINEYQRIRFDGEIAIHTIDRMFNCSVRCQEACHRLINHEVKEVQCVHIRNCAHQFKRASDLLYYMKLKLLHHPDDLHMYQDLQIRLDLLMKCLRQLINCAEGTDTSFSSSLNDQLNNYNNEPFELASLDNSKFTSSTTSFSTISSQENPTASWRLFNVVPMEMAVSHCDQMLLNKSSCNQNIRPAASSLLQRLIDPKSSAKAEEEVLRKAIQLIDLSKEAASVTLDSHLKSEWESETALLTEITSKLLGKSNDHENCNGKYADELALACDDWDLQFQNMSTKIGDIFATWKVIPDRFILLFNKESSHHSSLFEQQFCELRKCQAQFRSIIDNIKSDLGAVDQCFVHYGTTLGAFYSKMLKHFSIISFEAEAKQPNKLLAASSAEAWSCSAYCIGQVICRLTRALSGSEIALANAGQDSSSVIASLVNQCDAKLAQLRQCVACVAVCDPSKDHISKNINTLNSLLKELKAFGSLLENGGDEVSMKMVPIHAESIYCRWLIQISIVNVELDSLSGDLALPFKEVVGYWLSVCHKQCSYEKAKSVCNSLRLRLHTFCESVAKDLQNATEIIAAFQSYFTLFYNSCKAIVSSHSLAPVLLEALDATRACTCQLETLLRLAGSGEKERSQICGYVCSDTAEASIERFREACQTNLSQIHLTRSASETCNLEEAAIDSTEHDRDVVANVLKFEINQRQLMEEYPVAQLARELSQLLAKFLQSSQLDTNSLLKTTRLIDVKGSELVTALGQLAEHCKDKETASFLRNDAQLLAISAAQFQILNNAQASTETGQQLIMMAKDLMSTIEKTISTAEACYGGS